MSALFDKPGTPTGALLLLLVIVVLLAILSIGMRVRRK